MKTSTQLKARIRNLSKESLVETEVLLRNFMMERFLERIALSKYSHNFVLKGGMLIAAMVGIDTRTTMDMDTTIKGHTLSASEIQIIIEEVIRTRIDDGVSFSFLAIEEIREQADYPGYRVSISALFDKTRQTIKVDITTGDSITPSEIEYNYKLMFENRTIRIMTYNLETVLAEKFETIITRGVTNTRMRDFYDVYILPTFHDVDANIFNQALIHTAEKRSTSEQMKVNLKEIIALIEKNEVMIDHWKRYSKKYPYAADLSWERVIGSVYTLADMLN